MLKNFFLIVFTTLALSGCNSIPTIIDQKMEIELELPSTTLKTGEEISAKLTFKNNGSEKIRIYFIQNEMFRFNSHITLLRSEDRSSVSPPTIAPPHGYIIGEKDFYIIEPNESKSFEQKITLNEPGDFIIQWSYENNRTIWEGGLETLDGKTEALFDGKEVPYLWTGTIQTEKEITLE